MSDACDLILESRRVVTPEGVRDAAVAVRGGRIISVGPRAEAPAARERLDLGDLWLLPGLVDSHVHVNDPGRAEWEGFATATRAAAAGGVTTIVDMPLNSIPATTSAAALSVKAGVAAGHCAIDYGFWGGVIPGNAGELAGLAEAGALGFKCFLVPSGVPEFPPVGEAELREAMPRIAKLGLPLLAHAESPSRIEEAGAVVAAGDPRRHASWLASRPESAEVDAIRTLLRLAEETGCAVHVVHLAAASAVADLAAARRRRLAVTVETCPHYLTFAAEDIPDGATAFKCAPPIRSAANREALWAALAEGVIDLVATDHSPCPRAMKALERGDFFAAWGGIASLELGLSSLWTGARARGHTPADLARWMGEAPARLAGLSGRKGAIVPGADADLVAWNADASERVDQTQLHQRHPLTPYHGLTLAGAVEIVWLRGERVFESGAPVGTAHGQRLARVDRVPAVH